MPLSRARAYSNWERDRKTKNAPHDERTETEDAVSAVLTGIGLGFARGCVRGWIWPIEGLALATVLYLKRSK